MRWLSANGWWLRWAIVVVVVGFVAVSALVERRRRSRLRSADNDSSGFAPNTNAVSAHTHAREPLSPFKVTVQMPDVDGVERSWDALCEFTEDGLVEMRIRYGQGFVFEAGTVIESLTQFGGGMRNAVEVAAGRVYMMARASWHTHNFGGFGTGVHTHEIG
jgi:hypothetical protein